jgi:hypothetical protein
MTSTLCRSAALGLVIAQWVIKIAELFGIIVKTVLSMVENISKTLHAPGGFLPERGALGDCPALWRSLPVPIAETAMSSCPQPKGQRKGHWFRKTLRFTTKA